MKGLDECATAWSAGTLKSRRKPRLLFGRMQEDSSLESSLFPPGARTFCIASAGCTAIALASQGRPVDAVDINPVQARYAEDRLGGAPISEGSVDRMLRRARNIFSLLGPSTGEIRNFLLLSDPAEQIRVWRSEFRGNVTTRLFNFLLTPGVLRLFYSDSFVRALPADFGTTLRARFERGIALHSNRSNPYIWNMLLGCDPPGMVPPAPITTRTRVFCVDAVEFLEASPAYWYHGFSLSNIEDGALNSYCERLHHAIRRAAAPGAVVIARSLRNPRCQSEADDASQDRSMLWGRIVVHRIGSPERG